MTDPKTAPAQAQPSQLLQALQRLERAVGGAREGLWDWDLRENTLYFSVRWKEMLGYAPHELSDRFDVWYDLLHPDDRTEAVARVQRAHADPTYVYEPIFRMRHKDGSYRSILARATVQRDADGQPLYMSGSHVDVTDQMREQAHAKRQEAFVRQVIDSLPNPVFVKDAAGRLVLVNDAVARLLGQPKDQLEQRHNAEVHTDQADLANFEAVEAAVLAERRTIVVCETFRAPDGEIRHFITTKSPLQAVPDQWPVGEGEWLVLGTSVDLTEQKRIEEELRAAKEAAEAATRAKSQFLAVMSHEIRTPLSAVIGAAQLLALSNLGDDDRELVHMVDQGAHALLAVVNDVLDFSRIEEGRLEVERVPMNVADVVRQAVALLREQAERKGLQLRTEVADQLDQTVFGDPARLRQVLLNYLSNAVKFTEAGTVVAAALALDEDEERLLIRIEVRDTGVGIEPDVLPRLFNPFTQADATTTRRYGGSGLGLAICKRLMELMGGHLGVFSTVGAGATFWLTLALSKKPSADLATQPAQMPVLQGETRGRATRRVADTRPRVLVVDDNAVARVLAERILDSLGFAADVVSSGELAVTASLQTPYACILMDTQMPGQDGFAAARAIRSLETTRRVPIIALTANTTSADRQAATDAGMDDFVCKPIEVRKLAVALEKWAVAGAQIQG